MAFKTIPVLLYHRIGLPAYENDNLPPEEFEKQMQYLAERGKRTVSIGQYVSFLNRGAALPDGSFLLTFDDGAKNIIDYAFPIMKRHDFNATIFINTAYVGKTMHHSRTKRKFYYNLEKASLDGCAKEELWTFEYLSWPEMQFLAREGMDFGSHGHSHRVLTKLHRRKLKEELNIPRDILPKETGKTVECFSYPWGTFNPRIKKYVKACGYKFAFAVEHPHREDIFSIKRILVRTSGKIDDFISLLKNK